MVRAMTTGGQVVGAFVLTLATALIALFASVVVTAGVSGKMSAQAAGDALLWLGAGQLLAVAVAVAGFRGLARRWAGATPPWWSQWLLGALVLGAAAVLMLVAMVLMNR
jgi:hypothetical protein